VNTIDWTVLLLVILAGCIGYFTGMARLLSALARWAGTAVFGWWWYHFLQKQDQLIFSGGNTPERLLLFFAGVIIFFLLFSIMLNGITGVAGSRVPPHSVNRIIGLLTGSVLGLFLGLLIVGQMVRSSDRVLSKMGEESLILQLGGQSGVYKEIHTATAPAMALLINELEKVKDVPAGLLLHEPAAFTARPDLESQMLRLVNEERRKRGLSLLKADDEMRRVGRLHAVDMLKRNYFSHYTPEGADPFDRMRRARVKYHYAGENLAAAPTLARAHTGLMHSKAHREAILSKNFKRVGIAVIDGGSKGLMIAQEFRD